MRALRATRYRQEPDHSPNGDKSVLGQEFLGWDTNASGLKWLIFQNENGNKRIKSDYLLSNAVFGVTCTEARSTDIVSCFQGEPRKKTL